MRTPKPTDRLLIAQLRYVGSLLGTDAAYVLDGRFYFPLDSRWAVAISPESAGRLRVDVCTGARVRATMWTQAWDRDRLADLVLGAKAEALALTA